MVMDSTLITQEVWKELYETPVVIGRCRNCTYWRKSKVASGGYVCTKIREDPERVNLARLILDDAWCSEWTSAWLETEPDFGCVQFEVKDE